MIIMNLKKVWSRGTESLGTNLLLYQEKGIRYIQMEILGKI